MSRAFVCACLRRVRGVCASALRLVECVRASRICVWVCASTTCLRGVLRVRVAACALCVCCVLAGRRINKTRIATTFQKHHARGYFPPTGTLFLSSNPSNPLFFLLFIYLYLCKWKQKSFVYLFLSLLFLVCCVTPK